MPHSSTKPRLWGINLSRAFEQHLSELVRREKEEAWHSEHREGIDAYNRLVEKHGVFGDKWWKFYALSIGSSDRA